MQLPRSRVMIALAGVTMIAMIGGSSGAATAGPVRQSASVAKQAARASATSPTPLPSIGQVQPEKHPDVLATLNSLHRDSSGLVALTWTVKNNGTEGFHPSLEFLSDYAYQGQSSNGVTLTDEIGKIRYNPLRMRQSNSCVCNSLSAGSLVLRQGDSMYMFEMYKLPPSIKAVTVTIPGFTPLKNVQVS